MSSYYLSQKEINNIEKHYNKFFTKIGAADSGIILHEIASDDMHIDVVQYNPTEKFPYYILATIGMSGYTMKDAQFKNIELCMFLPKDWKLDNISLSEPQWYWPVEMLKMAARLPYSTNSILSVGHTFSKDAENTPFVPTTEMCCGAVTFPSWFNYDFFNLENGGLFSKKKVNFLCLTAINANELAIIAEKGPQYFFEEYLIKDGKDDLLVRNKR